MTAYSASSMSSSMVLKFASIGSTRMEVYVADFYFPGLQLLWGDMPVCSEKMWEYGQDIVAIMTCLSVVHHCKILRIYGRNHLSDEGIFHCLA